MSGKLSALTPGTSGVTPFRNPNDTGLLGLSNEILMEIALRVLLSDSPNVNALEGTCWRLRCICRDDHFRKQVPGAIFFSNLQRGNVACRQIDMSGFSGVLPAGEGRLVAYKQRHNKDCRECRGRMPTTCRAASCTVTALDIKKNTPSCSFDVSVSSSHLHVVGNDKLLVCSSNNLTIFNLTTGLLLSQLSLEEGEEREYVAASPCADGRIAYATALRTRRDRLSSDSMLAVWSPATGKRIDMPLDLPELTKVLTIETYKNIVLCYTQQWGHSLDLVEIWDLDTQQLYSSRNCAVLARSGLPSHYQMAFGIGTRSCVINDHKLVALNCTKEKILVWEYAAGADAVAVSTLHIHEDPSLPPIRCRYAQSLTLSPCEKWVIICYEDWELEARSLEQLQNAVALRGALRGGDKETMMTCLPSSSLHRFTSCIAVGRRVLFNMAEKACFGIWDPQKPHDPITTVSLGDKVSLQCEQGGLVDAVMLRKRRDGEQPTVCWPTQNMIPLGGSSILFGYAPTCVPVDAPFMLRTVPAPQGAILPLIVWDFDVKPPAACDASELNLIPRLAAGVPCCISS